MSDGFRTGGNQAHETKTDGEPETVELKRAIPSEIECLGDNVNALERIVMRLTTRLQNGSLPEPARPTDQGPEDVRPPHPCPVVEAIMQFNERITSVRHRIDDLCERVQL